MLEHTAGTEGVGLAVGELLTTNELLSVNRLRLTNAQTSLAMDSTCTIGRLRYKIPEFDTWYVSLYGNFSAPM